MLLWSDDFWNAQEGQFAKIEYENQNIFLTSRSQTLCSGSVGPFGGPRPSKTNFDRNQIESVLQKTVDFALINSKSQIEIRMPPRDFYPEFSQVVEQVLTKMKFRVKYLDINSSIILNHFSELQLNRNRRRDLRYWKELGAVYISNDISLNHVFECLTVNRKSRGISPSLGLDQLRKLQSNAGDSFSTHTVILRDQIIAAGIVLKLDLDIQYVFMWGDDPSLRSDFPSPLIFLLEGIVHHFTKGSPVRICLGTSSLWGEVDESLFRFKKSLGFEDSLKPTYILDL